jgi:hypothetical protein
MQSGERGAGSKIAMQSQIANRKSNLRLVKRNNWRLPIGDFRLIPTRFQLLHFAFL